MDRDSDSLKAKQQQYEAAVSLLSNLKDGQSVPQLFMTARIFFSLNSLVTRDNASISTWKKQLDDLQSQLASSVIMFLEQFDQSNEQFGNACLSLLYVGAEACERLEQENKVLSHQLAQEKSKNAELNKGLEDHLKKSGLKENLELHTRLVMQQQSMRQHEAETRELVQRLQHTMAEKNALRLEKERLAEESKRSLEILERQSAAILELMEECENNAKEKDQALNSLRRMNDDNQILKLNLKQHSKVIENLINVNSDMIEATNCYARMQDWDIGQEAQDNAGHVPENDSYGETGLKSKYDKVNSTNGWTESCLPINGINNLDFSDKKDHPSDELSLKPWQLCALKR